MRGNQRATGIPYQASGIKTNYVSLKIITCPQQGQRGIYDCEPYKNSKSTWNR